VESIRVVHQSPPGSDVKPQAFDIIQIDGFPSDFPTMPLDEIDVDQDNDHFAHPRHKRMEIVQRYWIARDRREIKNKDAWARSRYQISGKTLLCYEREFRDQKQAVLATAHDG
jgi:hypothetical protein